MRVKILSHRSLGSMVAVVGGLLIACGPSIPLEQLQTASASSATEALTTAMPTPAPLPSTSTANSTSSTSSPGTTPAADTSDGGRPVDDLPDRCSTFSQNCPAGYKCMPYSSDGGSYWNDTKCIPIVEQPSESGQPCSVIGSGYDGEDTCDLSSMCWNVDPETLQGTCRAFCVGSPENPLCVDPCAICPIGGDGVLAICLPTCDPLIPSCPPGEGCYPLHDGFVCSPISPQPSGVGSPCEYVNACSEGLACLSAQLIPDCEGSTGCCSPYCSVRGPDPCPELLSGTVCTPFFGPDVGPIDTCTQATVGVCVIPEK